MSLCRVPPLASRHYGSTPPSFNVLSQPAPLPYLKTKESKSCVTNYKDETTLTMPLISYGKMVSYSPLPRLSDDGLTRPPHSNNAWKRRFFLLLASSLITIATILTTMTDMFRSATQCSCASGHHPPNSLVKLPYSEFGGQFLVSTISNKSSSCPCQASEQILDRRPRQTQIHGAAPPGDG